MRTFTAILVACLIAPPAVAQTQGSQGAWTAKPAAQATRFRKLGVRPATLRAWAAARRSAAGAEAGASRSGEAGTIRAAAATRRRAPAPSPGHDSALTAEDRLALQFDLAWTGDYNGLVNGEATDKTTAAVKAFQKNRKFKETGVLNTQERAVLAAASRAKQAQVGWSLVDDSATGARLGIPAKQVPNRSQAKSGTRWSSAQGQVVIETFRIREPGTTLASVYEQQKKEPATRRLDVNILRPELFVLGGMQGLKKFYVRAELRDGEVRGVTVLYDQATENIMDPAALVTASMFTAFPSASGAGQMGQPARRKVEYGTGTIVSTAGHILTDRALADGCNVIVVSGYANADRQAEDRGAGLALLRVYGVPDLAPASFAGEPVPGSDLTLLGIADPQAEAGGAAVAAVAAKAKGEIAEPAPQLGFSGAPALDAKGHLVGMVQLTTPLVASVASMNSQPRAALVFAQPIRAFLAAQNLPLTAPASSMEAAKAAVVRVICVRK